MGNYMLNKDVLEQHVTDGLISKRKHPSLDLWVYNYTHRCQFDRIWTDVTRATRGLILDADYQVVGRPLPKFFNFGELTEPLPDLPYTVLDKLDGSLIIVCRYNGNLVVSTRGSFESDQAILATKLLQDKYDASVFQNDTSYLFELVGPSNKIVVNYDRDQLILLAVLDTATSNELPLDERLGFPVV